MEQRLIDADALKEDIRKNYVICTVGHYFDDLFQDFYNAIDAQPTIDAEPVRHGKWTHDGGYFKNRWICSECGYKWFSTKESGKFCPNCGARMDKDD